MVSSMILLKGSGENVRTFQNFYNMIGIFSTTETSSPNTKTKPRRPITALGLFPDFL